MMWSWEASSHGIAGPAPERAERDLCSDSIVHPLTAPVTMFSQDEFELATSLVGNAALGARPDVRVRAAMKLMSKIFRVGMLCRQAHRTFRRSSASCAARALASKKQSLSASRSTPSARKHRKRHHGRGGADAGSASEPVGESGHVREDPDQGPLKRRTDPEAPEVAAQSDPPVEFAGPRTAYFVRAVSRRTASRPSAPNADRIAISAAMPIAEPWTFHSREGIESFGGVA